MRVTFHEELEQLEAALHAEGSLVLRSLRSALNALVRHDLELADEVIRFDDEVDAAYVGIEEGVESLLARQTPVAGDLRRVLAVFRVNLHLERMADYCVTVAKLTKLTEGLPSHARLLEALEEMGTRVEDMIRVALVSFQQRDVEQARLLSDLDEAVDMTNRRAVEEVIALGADPETREWGLRMLMVSRCIERIGDHAVDIGE
ncbi:MAG: phosphate signaling complex protein PhoU, partial [Gaiellaceae bacterium]